MHPKEIVTYKSLDKVLYDEGLRNYMLQVFNYMTFALALSGLVSLGVSMSPALMGAIWGTSFKWVVMFAPVAMSLGFMFLIDKVSSSTAKLFLFAFSASYAADRLKEILAQ